MFTKDTFRLFDFLCSADDAAGIIFPCSELTQIRESLGLSEYAFASSLLLSQADVIAMLNGTRSVPLSVVLRLISSFGFPMCEFPTVRGVFDFTFVSYVAEFKLSPRLIELCCSLLSIGVADFQSLVLLLLKLYSLSDSSFELSGASISSEVESRLLANTKDMDTYGDILGVARESFLRDLHLAFVLKFLHAEPTTGYSCGGAYKTFSEIRADVMSASL